MEQKKKIWHPELSMINPEASIGKSIIHAPVWIGAVVTIGDGCKVQAFSFIPDGVTIEDNVFIGPHVVFTNDKHPPSGGLDWSPIMVRSGAVIGASVTILPGVEIGENAIIGAASVVTKNVPPGETWIGNPARRTRRAGPTPPRGSLISTERSA
jgi:UDP-2-acetamido-3-amino-2,3-dideoxy-glucuronate N-acetyltransferase